MCYPLCQQGYYGVGPVCFKFCQLGFTDDGAVCRKDAHIFAKQSYGRGAGVPMICNTSQERQNGLCYPKCISSHYGSGPVCWQRCPAGYIDDGAFCRRPFPLHIFAKNSYGRGAGGPLNSCAPGLELNGSLCYPRCQAGFTGNGPVCFQVCPVGYKDDGAMCRKDAIILAKESYGRGAGFAMNNVPVATDETHHTSINTPVHLDYLFSDLNDDPTALIIMQEPSHGKEESNTYTPNPGFEGADTILWKVTDGKNESNVAVTTIIVGNVAANNAPVAIDRTIAVTEDTPISVTVTCTDTNNDALFYQLLNKPQHGDYRWVPPNTVVYTPTANFSGLDSFTFRAHDGRDPSNISTISLTVNAVNDAPVILTQPFSTTRNSSAAVNLEASDAEGDSLTYTLITSSTYGSLSGELPNLTYTPFPGFVGADSFQIKASDSHGAFSTAVISAMVMPSNTAPLAQSASFTTTQDNVIAITLVGNDADGDPLSYILVAQPTHGTLSGSDMDWVYMPSSGYIGADQFAFMTNDGMADSEVVTASINVVAAPNETTAFGIVFEDSNANGQLDGEERGISGLQVVLTPDNLTTGRVQDIKKARLNYEGQTDVSGNWQIDHVPLGEYTATISSSTAVQLQTPVQFAFKVVQLGVQQSQPVLVKVVSHAFFLPILSQ